MKKSEKRRVERWGGALLYGGALAAGVALGAFSLVTPGTEVEAGENNYVRGVSHDAIGGVRLDEEITVRFKSQVLRSSVGPDTILIRFGSGNGNQARGSYLTGKFMYDKSTQRRVVIRPEAIQEYYQLVKGFSREDAARKTEKVIDRIERTGRFGRLDKIDRALVEFFGPSYGAGTRLDDDAVTGLYPPQLLEGDSLEPYRERIAGDDALYQDYLINGNSDAFDQLSQNSEYERFFHEVNSGTGVPDEFSVLRNREYRQVLINRRNERRVVFIPQIPIRGDLTDSGFVAGQSYSIIVPASQPGVFNTVLTKKGRRPLLQAGGRDFSTLFTTVPGTVNTSTLYLGGEARSGVASLQKPRIICMTPPNGESFVDATTDWEDPDNQFEVPLQARRTFTVRLRFAQPLDPRSVNTTNFTITKTKTNPGQPNEESVNVPVAVGTFLNQVRPGIVEVEVTPATNLDPFSQYTVTVRGNVRTLGSLSDGSQAILGQDFNASFIVGPGPVPVSGIQDDFTDITNRADAGNDDTLDQQTTAMWNAPALFDPEDSGKLVSAFMPFVGWGEGAPTDPQNPQPPDPDNPNDPNFTDTLVLAPGESITFVTEGLDPGDPDTFGKQITYEYKDVSFTGASATAIGRFPLVIRSQDSILLSAASSLVVAGSRGGNGAANTDLVAGPPTGGLGGDPGPGGFRGGDGAIAPLTDENGVPILDGFGRLQFDPDKFNGSDGFPSFASNGPLTGGAGAGGFSGDQEGETALDPEGNPVPEASPERIREAGGGGAHAVDGGDGAGVGGTQQSHPDGHQGGTGGIAYGESDMSDQPINSKGAPELGEGSGGAGGGGGGGEDDPNVTSGDERTAGPEDAGGGGGGGGGGGLQLVARNLVVIDSSVVDASGGVGGATFDSGGSEIGESAPGGSGAGGTIWIQCYGDIQIRNGSRVDAAGGIGTQTGDDINIGTISPDPPDEGTIKGLGGFGGDGYLRFEDSDGVIPVGGNDTVLGSRSDETFRPVLVEEDDFQGEYPAHPGVLMTVNKSQAFSRWFNTELDTPSYVALFDDPLTPEIEGTKFEDAGQMLEILVRTAPGSLDTPGRPDLVLATPWVPLEDVSTISDRRFLQFRVDFEIGLSYQFDEPRPFVDFISIAVEL
jgi:hypothetical protein